MMVLVVEGRSRSQAGQIMAKSNEVTLNTSHCWEYTKMGFNSGFGIIVICLGQGPRPFG